MVNSRRPVMRNSGWIAGFFVLVVVFFWLTSPDTPEKLRDGTRKDLKLGS